jgi:hypothetical protein
MIGALFVSSWSGDIEVRKQRGRRGYLVALVTVSGACVLILAACDNSTPTPTPSAPSPTTLAPTATVVAPQDTPTMVAVGTEGEVDFDQLLTELPDLPTFTPIPTPAGVDAAASIQIYVQAVRALLTRFSPPYVYVSPYLGQGERLDDPNETMPLPQGLIPALQSANPGPKYEIRDFADAIGPLDDGAKVNNSGVFITLGEITGGDEDKSVSVVRGSVYIAQSNAEGDRFRMKRASSGWTILDTTQEWRE